MHMYFLHAMIYRWLSLAASILVLFTANPLAAIFSPFDIRMVEDSYRSQEVDFRQNNNSAINMHFCFEKALSLGGLGYWCSIQGDAYGNQYGRGTGLYAYAYDSETMTLHPTDVCQAVDEQKWKEVPEYCYDGVCPLPWAYDACSYRYEFMAKGYPLSSGHVFHSFQRQYDIGFGFLAAKGYSFSYGHVRKSIKIRDKFKYLHVSSGGVSHDPGVTVTPWIFRAGGDLRQGVLLLKGGECSFLHGGHCDPAVTGEFPVSSILGFCFFSSLLLHVLLGIYSSVKKNIFIHLKSKLFRKNGGLLLEQHIANAHGPGEGCTKLFTAEELAVEITSVKEKVLVEASQIECFVNEIITLAHIKHQNVIKLLGCCLETEAPTLVYEFASNGTLSDYIHGWKNGEAAMPHWDILLEIASDSAAGLAYLHSSSIIHGNVKSSNILLTDCLAKVAGFGPPRSVPSNESQVSTLVQRTLGYLDPEYFVTGKLIDKSDVYSLGVVLVEILTGEKPISFDRPENQRNIICHFLLCMEQENGLYLILAPQVKEENREQVRAVAELAKQCLKLSSAERPTIEEVARELKRHSDTQLTVHVN